MSSTTRLERYLLVGELGLDGRVPCPAPCPSRWRQAGGLAGVVHPRAERGGGRGGGRHRGARRRDAGPRRCASWGPADLPVARGGPRGALPHRVPYEADFGDVKGQEHVKRALEVAAAGSHNLLMVGPPGSGRRCWRSASPILPPLTFAEALETTKIHSVAGADRGGKALSSAALSGTRTPPFPTPV